MELFTGVVLQALSSHYNVYSICTVGKKNPYNKARHYLKCTFIGATTTTIVIYSTNTLIIIATMTTIVLKNPYAKVRPTTVRGLNVSVCIIATVHRRLPILLRRRQRAAQHVVVLLLLLLLVLVLLVFVLQLLKLPLQVLLLLLVLLPVGLMLQPLLLNFDCLRIAMSACHDRTNRLIQQFAYSIVFGRFFQLYSRAKSS